MIELGHEITSYIRTRRHIISLKHDIAKFKEYKVVKWKSIRTIYKKLNTFMKDMM